MIVADILMWFLLIAGTYIVINGYWLTTTGLFPEPRGTSKTGQ